MEVRSQRGLIEVDFEVNVKAEVKMEVGSICDWSISTSMQNFRLLATKMDKLWQF